MASYVILLVLAISVTAVLGRPQEFISSPFDLASPHLSHGTFIGEIIVSSSRVDVERKKATTTPKPTVEIQAGGGPLASKFIWGPEPSQQADVSADGPRFSKFIGGSESEVNVGSNAGVAVAEGPSSGVQISGSVITFNNGAQVEPIAE